MNDRKTVVILYSKDDNDSAALLLEDFINSRYSDFFAVAIPDTEYLYSPMVKIKRSMRKIFSTNFFFLNKLYYRIENWFVLRKFEKQKNSSKTVQLNQKTKNSNEDEEKDTDREKLKNVFYRYDPEIVLCLTPISHRLAIKYKNKLQLNDLKIYALITDYVLDKRFIENQTDGYFVQNEEVRERIIFNEIKNQFIEVVGTPISEAILVKHDKAAVFEKYGIPNDDRKIILITAGRIVTDQLKEVIAYYVKSNLDTIFLVNARGSKSLLSFMKLLINKNENRLFALNEIDDMAEIYSIIDIAVTAPTSLTTYELLMRHKPFILIEGAPTSERENASYLISKQVALSYHSKEELISYTDKMLNDEDFSYNFIERSLLFENKNTLELIASKLYKEAKTIFFKRHPALNDTQMLNNTDKNSVLMDNKNLEERDKKGILIKKK